MNTRQKTPRSTLSKIIWAAVIIALAIAFVAYRRHGFKVYGTKHDTVGQVASDFELPRFGAKNQTIQLSDYRGQVVLLDFWATWCLPCKREVKILRHINGLFKNDDFKLISINVDEPSHQRGAAIRKFGRETFMTYPTFLDDHRVQLAYGVQKLPTMILIGRDGTIRRFFSGVTQAGHISRAVKTELQRTAPAPIDTSD